MKNSPDSSTEFTDKFVAEVELGIAVSHPVAWVAYLNLCRISQLFPVITGSHGCVEGPQEAIEVASEVAGVALGEVRKQTAKPLTHPS